MARMRTIAERAQVLLGTAVVATTPIAGGDVSNATRLRLSDGSNALIKTRPHAPPGLFEAEAWGLRWLRVPGGVAVPDVLGVSEDCIIVSWVEPGRPTVDAAEDFAQAMARTHASDPGGFGAARNGYIATLPLPNKPESTWAAFYVNRRLLPYLRLARDRHALSDLAARDIETVMHRIEEFCDPAPPPARIHGDLWSGNLVWAAGGPAHVIDPAAHGGHPETDLAMLSLFGAPHLSRLLDAYEEAASLSSDWRHRIPLHQLHPLLVHAAIFGGTYGGRAGSAARELLEGPLDP
ncbi:MAG: fructosamine kinase family protein [Nocardioidaceae bacterium]|jgi:fructosamine-3-kinase|nr:fructosamine kinase family protein [Nocardioidaceae bacterium]